MAAEAVDNIDLASVEIRPERNVHARKTKRESSTTEEEEHQSTKKNGTKEHPGNADGNGPFSQQSLSPLMSGNHFNMRKTAAQALIDMALMMANISQLRTLLTAGDDIDYYVALISLVVVSLSLQLLFAILIFIIWMLESEQRKKDDNAKTLPVVTEAAGGKDTAAQDNRITSQLNYISVALVFVITVINMFIGGFGINLESLEHSVKKSNSS